MVSRDSHVHEKPPLSLKLLLPCSCVEALKLHKLLQTSDAHCLAQMPQSRQRLD